MSAEETAWNWPWSIGEQNESRCSIVGADGRAVATVYGSSGGICLPSTPSPEDGAKRIIAAMAGFSPQSDKVSLRQTEKRDD